MQKIITKLKSQKKSLGGLQFDSERDSNYMNRENNTTMLLRVGFDKDKNVHIDRFNKIIHIHTTLYKFNDVKKFKNDMNNYIESCINELELRDAMNEKEYTSKGGNNPIKLTQKNKQTNTQTINIGKVFDKIIEDIETSELDPQKIEEAKEYIAILKDELEKEKPVWSKVKTGINGILNFSRDSFIQCIPVLLEKFGGL